MSSTEDHDHEELTEEQAEGSRPVRVLVRATLALAALVVVYVLLFGGSEYTITAEFQNAAQLVPAPIGAGLPSTPPLSPIAELAKIGGALNNRSRCPGANERDPGDNSTPFTANGTLACDPSQVPVGP